jgi:hypothetical protein
MCRVALLALVPVLAAALAVAGCGGGGSQRPPSDGVLWLSWTVRGQPVSDATCKSIDHLILTMDTVAGPLEIEPIPCLRGLGWEYDGVPAGDNFVFLDAVDAQGSVTLEGASSVEVTATKPATPFPLDLAVR